MPEWVTYRLSDFLLFSARTYYRMFELYHREIWPAQAVIVALALGLMLVLRRDHEARARAIAGLLACSWLWVAIAFHLGRYAEINWAAKYFAAGFIVQAILLGWHGVIRNRLLVIGAALPMTRTDATPPRGTPLRRTVPPLNRVVSSLFLVALMLQTVVGVSGGRSWHQLEFPGLTPDATAIATLLVVSLTAAAPRVTLVIPISWCAIGGATLWALGSPEAWILMIAGIIGLGSTIRIPRARARATQP